MNTNKKNQHYIPKFYLRNFSYKENQNQIGIFHYQSSFFYQTAKLKKQGSKNFFYGKDGKIEDSLSELEGLLATTIRDIVQTKNLPKKGELEHYNLLAFVGLTHLRNPIFIEKIKMNIDLMRQQLLELDPDCNVVELVPEIPHDNAVAESLSHLDHIIDTISDLDYKLLINTTSVPFLTSDFPVVKYNKFLETKKWKHGKTGYGSLGLQIFIPLNPKTIIVFYDSRIYKVGFKKERVCELNNLNDILKLNELQMINCFETIYFNEGISENYIKKLVKNCSKYNRANVNSVKAEFLLEKGESPRSVKGKKKNLIVMSSTDCETNLAVSKIKIHSGSKKIKLTNSMVLLRPHSIKIREQKRYY